MSIVALMAVYAGKKVIEESLIWLGSTAADALINNNA